MGTRAKIIIGCAIVTIGLVGYGYWRTVVTGNYGAIKFTVHPPDAKVAVDGHGKTSTKDFRLPPGQHTFVFSRSGFVDTTVAITFAPKQTIAKEVSVTADAKSPIFLKWSQDNPSEEAAREGAVGRTITAKGKSTLEQYPLLRQLPYSNAAFSINFGDSQKTPGDPTIVAIYIACPVANRPIALKWIQAQGYNPNDYEIIYE